MRVLRILVAWLLLSVTTWATSLKIWVVDPNSHAVEGAQVSVFPVDSATPVAVLTTSGEGAAVVNAIPDGHYRVQVLAPGFASETTDVPVKGTSSFRVNLALARTSEIVVVTATRTPVSEQDSGASVSTLEADELQVMQPAAAADAIRFLPGAVVNTVGQRGGQASLFVRGGDSRYNKVIVDGVPGMIRAALISECSVGWRGTPEFLRGAQSTLWLGRNDQRRASPRSPGRPSRPRCASARAEVIFRPRMGSLRLQGRWTASITTSSAISSTRKAPASTTTIPTRCKE